MNRVPFLLFLALAASPAAAGAAEEGSGGTEAPRYELPDSFPRGNPLEEPLRAAVARAVADVTRPTAPWAAREGWRILAGVGPGAAPAAVEALGAADWFGRALLVRALGAMDSPALEPVLAEAARDPAWAVREAAAGGLGLQGGEASARALPALLRDPSWRVRRAALEAARERALRGGLPLSSVARAILPLASDPDPDVRREAWLALADLRDPAGREVLLQALRGLADRVQGSDSEDPEEPALRTALRLLKGLAQGSGDDPEILEYLRGFGETPWHALAGPALREWFRRKGPEAAGDREAVGRLVEVYLYPGDAGSMAAAEEALVELGEPAAEALLARIARPERATRQVQAFTNPRQALKLVLRLRGERAPETLAAVLRSRDLPFALRIHAAELGRRSCAAQLGAVFREILAAGEGSYGFDAQLLKGVAASGGEDAREIVARALVRTGGDEPPLPVRAAAAEILDGHPEIRDAAALGRALAAETDGDVLARLLPVAAAGGGPGAVAAVAPFLRDPRVRVRRSAARALTLVPGAEATRVLLESMASEDGTDDRLPWHGNGEPTEAQKEELAAVRLANAGSVREAAVSSLRFTAGPDARPLLEGLLDHGDPAVRGAAAANLATLGDPAATAALGARVEREREPGLRTKLLAALATLGGPAADAAFERYLAGDDETLRILALETLGDDRAGGKARAPAGTLRSARSPSAGISERLAAVRALGPLRDRSLTPFLLEALRKAPTGDERRAALEALGRSRDPAAAGPVAALLPAGDPARLGADELETAATAIETLGEIRAPEAAAPLASLLFRALPGALEGGGRAGAAARQAAVLAVQALGKCGGGEALDALLRASFHPGLSRAAEAATADPLRLRPPRREDERWKPELPDDLRTLGTLLAAALARWRDAELCAALRRRLDGMRADGRVYAVSEEWLSWLAGALGEPPEKLPNRPRWWARVMLLRQVLANPPRMTEADQEAARSVFTHEAEVSMEYEGARRTLETWRSCLRIHDPIRADREARVLEALDALAGAAERLKAGDAGAVAGAMLAIHDGTGRDERVARLGVEMLCDLGRETETAVALGEAALRSDATYPPNLRALGVARLHRGDGPGAAEILALALEELDGAALRPSRGSAWYRYYLGRALLLAGEAEEALAALGAAASLSDVVLDWIERDPALAPLREKGRLEEALAPARRAFEE